MNLSNQPKSAVVVSLDGLRPSTLGPYGNSWVDTVNFSRLAAESQFFEQCFVDCSNPENYFRSLLLGIHESSDDANVEHLVDKIGNGGQETILMTTDLSTSSELVNDHFDQVVEVELPKVERLAPDLESTQLALFFAEAVRLIERIDSPTLLWLDCNSLTQAWDAPYEYRQHLADEEDPVPPEIFIPSDLEFNPSVDDPDQLLGYQQAYGAQVLLLDQFLGVLMEQLDESTWAQDALFCLVGHRGYPLGEHGVVGFYRPLLYNELTHVPMMFRWPEHRTIGLRSQSLVQPAALYQALSDWFGCAGAEQTAFDRRMVPDLRERDAIVSVCYSEFANYQAIQTQGWKFVDGAKQQLFVRPDDGWEINEVGSLCPAIVDELSGLLSTGITRLAAGKTLLEHELPDHLAFGLE